MNLSKNIFHFLGLIIFFIQADFSYAQQPEIRFKHLSFKSGLAQSPISAIVKDSKGFIWLGNWKGLTRYDGYEFKNFHHDNNNRASLSNNRVNSIFKDRNGELWIGTSNGLNLYDATTETFKRIDIRNIKGGRNFISSVYEDSYGHMWTATFAGIRQLDQRNETLKELSFLNVTGSTDLYNGITFTLFEDRAKNIWAGTKNGARRFDPQQRKIIALPTVISGSAEFMNAKVLVIRQDKNGLIWFGTESSGLFVFDPLNNTFNNIRGNNMGTGLLSSWIRDIYIYDDENIWIGTRNGLSVYNTRLHKFSNYVHHALDSEGLNDGTIWSIMQDQSSGVWIGTFAGGLNVFYPSNANFSNIGEDMGGKIGLSHPVVSALEEDPQGGLWVGTYGGGINYLDRATNTKKYYPIKEGAESRNGVKSLAWDESGNLWIGTLDGLCMMDRITKKIRFYHFDVRHGKFSANLINAILPDKEGTWAGTNGGGLRYLKKDGSYRTYNFSQGDQKSLSDNFITALLKDEATGNLWVGTQNGLNYFDRKTGIFKRFTKGESPFRLNNNSVTTLLKDTKNRLWVGTEGGGISYFDIAADKFYALNDKKPLTDEVIHTILEDEQGDLWLSTDNGFYQLKFKNFNLPFKGDDIHIIHYDARDGLASNQFLSNSGIRLKNGELVFGGINGLTSFFPDQIIKNLAKPKVVLTDFLIRNNPVRISADGSALKQSISFTKHIELEYDQGYITLKFAALNFINSSKNAYAYQLEGLAGEDWHQAGTQRIINYTNLEPGKYVFKVKASNNDGVWNNEPTTLSITILPPWWRTWWAYMLYVAVASFIIRTVYLFLMARVKLKKELYLEQVQRERQQELHKMKIDFFTNISHEIRTPLTLILGPLEKMVENSGAIPGVFHKQLQQVQQNANRLMRLVTELMDFRKADTGNMKLMFSNCNLVHFTQEIFLSFQNLAEDKQMDYSFDASTPELQVYFDKDQLEKVLFNLLSNAFKFTPAKGRIEVSVTHTADWAHINIIDNGKGIEAEHIDQLFHEFFQVKDENAPNQGYGIGLALSKSIVELHKGTIEVKSEIRKDSDSTGTAFRVSLRTGVAHLDENMLVPDFMNSDNPVHYYLQSQVGSLLSTPAAPLTIETTEVPVKAKSLQTLLIIEDNEELREFIKTSFLLSYNILEAADGLKGLALITDEMPDLVISDVMMPGMDGLELCRRMKTDERISHIPIILLTARAAYIHQLNGLERGADAYITKPFSVQVLELNVKNILATKNALKQRFAKDFLLSAPISGTEGASPDEKFLHKFMGIVEAHLDDTNFDVTTIAQEIGMSKTVLYKKVQALTNLTIADFIKSIRLKRAALLLEQNKMGIAEIAFSVGFSDRKYFSKEFRKLYNMSPSEYITRYSA